MRLRTEWRRFLRKAWSVRFAFVSGIFSGASAILPYFVDVMSRTTFSIIAMIAAIGSIVASTIEQKELHDA